MARNRLIPVKALSAGYDCEITVGSAPRAMIEPKGAKAVAEIGTGEMGEVERPVSDFKVEESLSMLLPVLRVCEVVTLEIGEGVDGDVKGGMRMVMGEGKACTAAGGTVG